jgi:hypothetical protein
MRERAKPLMAWVAIFAISLQAVFGGAAAIAAPFDPSTIICHGNASDSGTERQTPAPAAHDCCSQCILCSTLSAAAAPDSFVLFVPSRPQTAAFIPFSAIEPTPLGGLAIHFARGPPHGV